MSKMTTVGDFIVKLFSTSANSSTINLSIDTGPQMTMTTTSNNTGNNTGGCGGTTTGNWSYTAQTYNTMPVNGTWSSPAVNVQYNGTSYTYITTDETATFVFDQEMLDAFNKLKEEENLREKYPVLKELWDEYQLAKQLIQDEECDKYFDKKYEGFKK